MAVETIREFLVKLGYKQDEAALKKFSDGINQATKAVIGLAAAVEASAGVVAVGIERFASNLAALYYEAQRTGTSARELKALDIAAQNLGANAGEVEQAIEGMARKLRENPAIAGRWEGILRQYGFTVKRLANGHIDLTDALIKFQQITKAGGPDAFYYFSRLGEQLGIQADTLNKLVQGDLLGEYIRALKELGPGYEEAAKKAAEFMRQWRLIKTQFESIASDVFTNIAKAFGFKDLQDFDQWLQTHHQEIVNTITNAIRTIVDAAKWLVKEVSSVISKLKEWDDATGGLSTKLLVIAGILKFSGAGSIVSGIISFGAALGGLALSAGPAVPVLAAIAASVTAINAARNAAQGKDPSNWISDSVNWLVKKATGGKESSLGGWIHDHLRPLGLRLNNPGNLKFAHQLGATLGARGFAQFADPQTGLLRLGEQLELYGRRGISTIADILKIYAPASENNLAAYIRDVSKQTGFGANQALNLADPGTLRRLMDAIILHEQGVNPFSAQEVGAAARRAISIKSEVHVYGVTDADKVADKVQERQNRDLAAVMRNVVPAVQ